MALPASDSFTAANGAGLSANWTTVIGVWLHDTNRVYPSTGSFGVDAAYWNLDAFGNDHFSQVVIVDRLGGPAVRVGATQGYVVLRSFGGTSTELHKFNGTTLSLVNDYSAQLWVDGDTVKLEAVGNAFKVYVNGVQAGATVNDSTYLTGGAAGIIGEQGGGALPLLDDFAADNVSAGAATPKSLLTLGVGDSSAAGLIVGGPALWRYRRMLAKRKGR